MTLTIAFELAAYALAISVIITAFIEFFRGRSDLDEMEYLPDDTTY